MLACVLLFQSLSNIPLNVWPLPQTYELGKGHVLVEESSFEVIHNLDPHSMAATAINTNLAVQKRLIFSQLPTVPFDSWLKSDVAILPGPLENLLKLVRLTIEVEYPEVALGMAEKGSEAYTLSIAPAADGEVAEAKLKAFTVWGALHGLWTFVQLMVTIDDWPRFPWRGFLVDTSRHFIQVATLKRLIDGLAMSRFNVLHWHIIDSHSFSVELESLPEAAKKGSWHSFYADPTGLPPATYSAADVKEIVRYAALRGVRVMPEIDTPAHVTAMGKAVPGMLACEDLHFAAHAMDPSNENNYEVLADIFEEVSELFPDQFIHLGADELNFDCWRKGKGARVQAWAQREGITLEQALKRHVERIVPMAEELDRTVVIYADPFLHKIAMPQSAILQVWTAQNALNVMKSILAAKHRVIFSAGWYLDMAVPTVSGHSRYSFEETWKDFYMNDPVTDAKLTPQEASLVMGGEVCLWSEQVDDTNIFTKAFPRTSAAGERLWSTPGCGIHCRDSDETMTRLARFRCLMVLLGVRGGPIGPDYCPYVYLPSVLDHHHSAAGEAMVDVVERAVDSVEMATAPVSLFMTLGLLGCLALMLVHLKRHLRQSVQKSL